MSPVLLDSSAVLAHFFKESGNEVIENLFADPSTTLYASVLTIYEFNQVLGSRGITGSERQVVIQNYIRFFDEIISVDLQIAQIADELRQEASARISSVDLLIAATAHQIGALFVHRDHHFLALPSNRPTQLVLPPKS